MTTTIAFPTWLACATCMGNPDDPNVIAASWAILFMLGVLVAVFGMFVIMLRKMITSARNCQTSCAPWDEMSPATAVPSAAVGSATPRPLHPLVPAVARPASKPRQLESVR